MSEAQGNTIPKTMLILKSQSAVLGAVETFLRNRGWKLHSTTNLKEALIQIVSQKPSYVLISVDHDNKKVRTLPKLLASAFPVATIVFAEVQSAASFKTLNESATEYRVYPPLTGPAIERCVNKYLKDQQTKISIQENISSRAESAARAVGESISIKGGGHANSSIQGGSFEFGTDNASLLFSQFLAEDTGNTASPKEIKANNNLIFAQALDEDDAVSETHFIPSQKMAEETDSNQQSGPKGFGQTYVQPGSAGNLGTYVPPTDNSGESDVHQKSDSQGPSYSGNQQGHGKEGLGSREYRRSQASAAKWAQVDGNEYSQKLRDRQALSDANETLIARGTQKSLEQTAEVLDGAVKEKIEETTRAVCIIVESERFSGYLVAVMGKNRKIDQIFIESVKGKLIKFLKENGEEVAHGDSLDIKIKQVDFEPWALEYANFLRKSVHQGNEVSMAYFPRRPIKAILEDSKRKDMVKIHLNEFHGDRQIEFDAYVYLPSNDKYVLYTPKGGVLYNKQMERLKKQGVTHMHVQKDAAAAITKYQAQNYLNDMIDEHAQKQEVISKVKLAS
jgi:hypothetical protein